VTNEFAPERIGGYKIVRFDSTLVSIAGTLLNKMAGLRVGIRPKYVKPGDPVHLKFSVGFDGLKPIVAKVYDGQTYLSEDVALREIIKQYKCTDKEMIVFDRGISRRATWDEFNGQGRVFVTRVRALKDKVRHEVLKELTNIDQAHPICIGNLLVEKDQLVYLMNQNHKKTKYPYRLIRTYNPKKKKVYFFLTNELDLSLKEILQIYQRRWDIEVFFKFLKQEFGFKHFLARNRNGIEVILFMTLITFILVYIYFKYNGIESFKIAKLKFIQELEFDSMKLIVEFCKGDAQLLHLLKPF
jgi:transposase